MSKIVIFVPDIPELEALRAAMREAGQCKLIAPRRGYWQIESEGELVLNRKAMRLPPAVWYSLLSGGFLGRISEYGRDTLRIVGVDEPGDESRT